MMDGMARSLGYADAVLLLGGQDNKIVTALEKITGGILLGATPAAPAILGLFDAKAEFVRLSHDLVRRITERRSGLSRYGRTQRLEAAHAVLVITAYFEALENVPLPIPAEELKLIKSEQIAISTAGNDPDGASLVEQLMRAATLLPQPQQSPEQFTETLLNYYAGVSSALRLFVVGLDIVDRLDYSRQRDFVEAVWEVPPPAVRRYTELFRQLVADFPEVACWASQREHRATRAALAGLEEMLREISTGRAPNERRQALATAYRADLDRPVVESGDVPESIRVPTLDEAYLPPRFRAADASSSARVSEESWWYAIPIRDDLQHFLVGHLTSPQAVRAPLLVLGQPGSGKSVLTRVLAARLPAPDFMPIRVVLRDIPAADDVQDQIEYAIRQATGERIEWPALSRSADDAMPVILLDGFDELLQAVGVNQTDYLVRVARFQRREAEQGRPIAVVVTSRTAVADRARAPEETVALRLEPFDEPQITRWLDIWNGTNALNFAPKDLRPLPPETVLDHLDLAEQPLLLLMLALYDADGNALQRSGTHLRTDELYEQLLSTFAQREIVKQGSGLSDAGVRSAVENELRRLSVVAFAMFNRSALWITEEDLERDLTALRIYERAHLDVAPGMRAPLKEAELTLGRFFFIHRARAARDEARLQTYEFLHATFGEYLVARLTWQALLDLAARDTAASASFHPGPAEDDLLRALLSFEPLSLRAPIIDFLASRAGRLAPEQQSLLRDMLLRLFRAVDHTPPGPRFAEYRPQTRGEPTRYAVYTANLLLLALCMTGEVRGSTLVAVGGDPIDAWRSRTLFWRSQLSAEGWTSLVMTMTHDRIWDGSRRDVVLTLQLPATVPVVDPDWTFNLRPGDPESGPNSSTYHNLHPDLLRRQAYFMCDITEDVALHALEPLAGQLDVSLNTFVRSSAGEGPSAAHALVELLMSPSAEAYHRCARIAASDFLTWDDATYVRYTSLVLGKLAADGSCAPETAADVLETITYDTRRRVLDRIAGAIVQSVIPFLGLDDPVDQKLARVLERAFQLDDGSVVEEIPGAEAIARLAELGLPLPRNVAAVWSELCYELIDQVAGQRPDLAERLARIEAE